MMEQTHSIWRAVAQYPPAHDTGDGHIGVLSIAGLLVALLVFGLIVLLRHKRLVPGIFIITAVLWLQGNVLWHDTAHAGHNHGPELMCKLDVLIPELGTDECTPGVVAELNDSSAPAKFTSPDGEVACYPSYLSRAPPQSYGGFHR